LEKLTFLKRAKVILHLFSTDIVSVVTQEEINDINEEETSHMEGFDNDDNNADDDGNITEDVEVDDDMNVGDDEIIYDEEEEEEDGLLEIEGQDNELAAATSNLLADMDDEETDDDFGLDFS